MSNVSIGMNNTQWEKSCNITFFPFIVMCKYFQFFFLLVKHFTLFNLHQLTVKYSFPNFTNGESA